MKILRTAIASLAFFASCVAIGHGLALKAHWEAEGKTWEAYHLKEAERFKALTANIELEAKKTTMYDIRQTVIAEMRRCQKSKKVCL